MLKRNVVLIKNKRAKMSADKRERLHAFFRTYFMVSIIFFCIIGLLVLSITVDERSKEVGFGIKENAIEIYRDEDKYVMNFFSNKVEMSVERTKEGINKATEFLMCLIHPGIRAMLQGIMMSIS